MWRHPPYQQSLPPPPTACSSSRPVLRRPASFSGTFLFSNYYSVFCVVVVVGAGNLNFDVIIFICFLFKVTAIKDRWPDRIGIPGEVCACRP